jgi:hypothetical protein
LRPYVQGANQALVKALAKGASNSQGNTPGFLTNSSMRVSTTTEVAPNVATVPFAVTEPGNAYQRYAERFLGTAVLVGGRWEVSWATACVLIEQEGVVCPGLPAGVTAALPLPYSVSERTALAAQAPDLLRPGSLAVEPDGDLLIADSQRDQVLQWQPDGAISVFAGTGQSGFSGDNGPAVDARLDDIGGMAMAPDGTLYFVDGERVRAISPDGIITTVAGDGKATTTGNGGPAVDAGLASPSDVAVSANGSLFIADGTEIRKVAPDGTISMFFKGSGRYGIDVNTPQGEMAFLPTDIAFDGAGNLIVFSFSPKEIFLITPPGKATLVGEGYATQLARAPDGNVLIASHSGPIQEVTATGVKTYMDLGGAQIRGFAVPGEPGGFQPDGLAITSSGTIYTDTTSGNGYSERTVLMEITPGKRASVLLINTPLAATLPALGAPGFPTSTYPAAGPAHRAALASCPSLVGLEKFGPAEVAAALARARVFNDIAPSRGALSFFADMRASDRSWWAGLFATWADPGYELGHHRIVSVQPADKDTFAAAVGQACGTALVDDSLVVDVGPSGYSSQVSHLYFLDRLGHPLVYFQYF